MYPTQGLRLEHASTELQEPSTPAITSGHPPNNESAANTEHSRAAIRNERSVSEFEWLRTPLWSNLGELVILLMILLVDARP